MVLSSRTNAPDLALDATPSSSNQTDRTTESLGRLVIKTSARSIASTIDPTMATPSLAARSLALASRSNPTTSWPIRARLDATAPPIPVDHGICHTHLREEVRDVRSCEGVAEPSRLGGRAYGYDFAGRGVGPAKAIELHRIRTAHQRQSEGIAGDWVVRKGVESDEDTLTGPASHEVYFDDLWR